MLKKVVFLDRDGVINVDSVHYIKSRSEFEFIPGSIEAISLLTLKGFTSFVITNQSAIARKLISFEELQKIHKMMTTRIAADGGKLTDIFFCPHMPEDGCSCRKPKPGLIIQAQVKYDIDLADAVMIGDSAKDIECAYNAGCGRAVLVKTGKESGVEQLLNARQIKPSHVAADLLEASKWLIAHVKKYTAGSGN